MPHGAAFRQQSTPRLDLCNQGRVNPDDIALSNVIHWWPFLFPRELVEHLSKLDRLSFFETRADVTDIDKSVSAICGKRKRRDTTG